MTRRLAYLGPAGTYSEEAARQYDPSAQHLPMATTINWNNHESLNIQLI